MLIEPESLERVANLPVAASTVPEWEALIEKKSPMPVMVGLAEPVIVPARVKAWTLPAKVVDWPDLPKVKPVWLVPPIVKAAAPPVSMVRVLAPPDCRVKAPSPL